MRTTALAALLLVASWLAVNAVWGRTGPDTVVSSWLAGAGPLEAWVAGGLGLLGAVAVGAARWRRPHLLALALMLLAYTAGVVVSRVAKQALDPSHVLLDRSFLLIPVLPMWLVAKGLRAGSTFPLRFGDWSAACDLGAPVGRTWWAALGWAVLLLALPSLLFFQLGVRFEPVTTGRLWPLLPTILSLSALNGLAEELLFRGLLMAPLVGLLGVQRGIWLQAAFFGLHHWGASPGLIAALPMALLLTLLGALFGRSAVATGGIGWAVVLHACLDVAVLSAHLPRTG